LQEDLDIDSKERLYQLFSLRFETLKIMLLQGDNENYQKQLERIQTLVNNYYTDEEKTSYSVQIKKLGQVDLSPELPKANASLELLEKIMTDKNIMDKAENKLGLK